MLAPRLINDSILPMPYNHVSSCDFFFFYLFCLLFCLFFSFSMFVGLAFLVLIGIAF